MDSKSESLLLSAKFTAKLGLVFVLTLGTTFSERFHFKANRKSIRSSKRRYQEFSKPVEILNVFNTLTLKRIFWKTKTFFKKLEYCFLVESTKIENAPFRYKTAISEANVKTSRMACTKRTYKKERSFASNCFIFLTILFQFKNFL